MKIKASIKVGEVIFNVESEEKGLKDSLFEILDGISTLERTPLTCSLCKGETEWMVFKTTKGNFIYIKRKCKKCEATATMGERKDGMLFWREEGKFRLYEGKENYETTNPNPTG